MTLILRRRVGDVYVVAKQVEDGWEVDVTDAMTREVTPEEREAALREVMRELSSLRGHIWKELGEK